jgi:hypothetical protein
MESQSRMVDASALQIALQMFSSGIASLSRELEIITSACNRYVAERVRTTESTAEASAGNGSERSFNVSLVPEDVALSAVDRLLCIPERPLKADSNCPL